MKILYRFHDGKHLPIVDIKLKSCDGWYNTRAYVDSGASYSLFHADVAEILGLVLESGELIEMTVGDGDSLKVYIHRIKIICGGEEFTASIGFSKGIGVGFNIIGRKDIFDWFIVCFHEQEKFLELTYLNRTASNTFGAIVSTRYTL